MAIRRHGMMESGGSFSEATVRKVWDKATIVPGINPAKRRKDDNGAWIEWDQYGDTTEGGTGWEIDHIRPVSRGGADEPSNLQPLQWQNNRAKGDDWPKWEYKVTAKG
jgi:5-methylcytosine-specific restriction endonuclease McrA